MDDLTKELYDNPSRRTYDAYAAVYGAKVAGVCLRRIEEDFHKAGGIGNIVFSVEQDCTCLYCVQMFRDYRRWVSAGRPSRVEYASEPAYTDASVASTSSTFRLFGLNRQVVRNEDSRFM